MKSRENSSLFFRFNLIILILVPIFLAPIAVFNVYIDKDNLFFSEREMFDVNVHGLFYCIKVATPDMIDLEEGHIINISSIAGTNGVETMSGYVGTKHAVTGIGHSIFKELRNYGIKVSTIYPGSTNTGFFDKIEFANANENMMRPEDIAMTILQTLETHPNYHVVDVEVRPLMSKGKPGK